MVAPISKASARQRAGRAGRVRPGKCYRFHHAYVNTYLFVIVFSIEHGHVSFHSLKLLMLTNKVILFLVGGRLYTEDYFLNEMVTEGIPEMQRTNLVSCVIQVRKHRKHWSFYMLFSFFDYSMSKSQTHSVMLD